MNIENCQLPQNRRAKSLLAKYKLNYSVEESVNIPIRDNGRGKIDILVTIKELNLLIPIWFRGTRYGYAEKALKSKLSKYNRAYRGRKGFSGTYLVSDVLPYGYRSKTFLSMLENHILGEENLEKAKKIQEF